MTEMQNSNQMGEPRLWNKQTRRRPRRLRMRRHVTASDLLVATTTTKKQ